MLYLLNHYHFKAISFLLFGLFPTVFFIPRAAVGFLIGIGLLSWLKKGLQPFTHLKNPLSYLVLSLIVWNAITSLWSPEPLNTLLLSARLSGILFLSIGWISWLSNQNDFTLNTIKKSLLYGIICSLFFLIFNYILGNPWQSWVSKSSAKAFVPLVLILSVGLWPFYNYIRFNKFNTITKISCVLFLFGSLSLVDCDTSLVAIIAGVVAYSSYICLPNFTFKMVKVSGVSLVILLPWLFSIFLNLEHINQFNHNIHSVSYVHRLHVWQFVSDKISHQWLKGYGGESSRAEMVGGKIQNWPFVNSHNEKVNIRSKSIPLHPHNLPLQLWLELGLLGAILGSLIYYFIINQIKNLKGRQAASYIGFFVAANVVFWINLGCWQSWWWAALCLIGPLIYFPNLDSTETV